MRRAAIEMEKIVAWVIGALVLLAVLMFMIAQLNPNSDGGIMQTALAKIFSLGK